MIKNIKVNDLLFSDLLVREPVDDVNEDLSSEVCGKIILTGSRGCGKSVVLGSRQVQSAKTKHPAFLTSFEGCGMFGSKDNEFFNKSVIEHYYEVLMCKRFLNYVKSFYPELFSRFGRLDMVTTDRLMEVDNYIENAIYKGCSIKQKLFSGEVLSEFLALFRSKTGCESLTLMIDRFDWTHNSDPRVQEILNKYFSMFEKVIITSDDSRISSDKRQDELKNRGFQTYTMEYSTNLESVVSIVERRFSFDENSGVIFPIDKVVAEDYLKMIEKFGGNLNNILDTFLYAEGLHNWDSQKDIHDVLSFASDEKLNCEKVFRKSFEGPKLYL